MTKRLELPKFQAFDSNGDPLSGGLVYTYMAGTSTLKTTYSDYDASTANANPVVLDARGEAMIYLQGSYKINLTDSAGAQIPGWPVDNIQGGVGADAAGEDYYYPDATASDQGVTGNSDTIKYAVDTIGSDSGTIYLKHDGAGATTTYTLTTSESVPSNIQIEFENGAIIDGAGTLTLDNANQIVAQPNQKVFGSSITVSFTNGGECTIEWLGGIGDDSTDCASAINAIITSTADVLTQTDKTYLVKSAIAMNVNGCKLLGFGTIKGDAESFAAQTQFISITADNCIIQDITVDQDDNPTGWSIHISSATNTKIRRVVSTNVQQAFVVIGDTAIDTYVLDCYQKDEGYGILVSDPTGSSGLFARGNHFQYDGDAAGGGDGIEINAPTNGFARFDVSNNYIAGYIDAVANQGLGIGVAKGSRGVIANNIVEDVEHDGIHVENHSSEIVISDNVLRDIGPAAGTGGGMGIAVYDSSNVIVSNNLIKNVNSASGIQINAYPDTAAQNAGNKAVGNTIDTVDRDGISFQGQTEFVMSNNVIIGASQGTAATWSGIALSNIASCQPCDNGIIENNIIKDSGNATAYAIQIDFMGTTQNNHILLKNNNREGTTNGIDVAVQATNIDIQHFGIYEDVTTAAPTLTTFGTSRIDSTDNAVDATLPDAEGRNAVGRIKVIVMTESSNSSTVSITSHVTSDPEVATFDAVDETWVGMWSGTEWVTIYATCTFV